MNRALSLVIGPLYLYFLAYLASNLTGRPMWLCALIIGTAATVNISVLIAFGLRAYLYRESQVRFGLSTLFLITIPLAVYLAGIRWVLTDISPAHRPLNDFSNPYIMMISILFMSSIFVFITTTVLLLFAEAFMWCAAWFVKGYAKRHQ